MNPEHVMVHPPTPVVFLCGGAISQTDDRPKFLRDAFFRAVKLAPVAYDLVLAEDADPLTTDVGYKDLLTFESDIAQVVGVILLFAESAGSLAELGAFSALDTIAPSLIAVLDDHYYSQSSFIRNGPVKFLETTYGEEWVHVLERADIGISEQGELHSLDSKKLIESLQDPIDNRLRKRSKRASFSSIQSGHIILLITGLCQEIGALTISEIKKYLTHFDVHDAPLSRYLYCAILLRWIKKFGREITYFTSVSRLALL